MDLDQLLNDFEYSELTDQQAKSVPERPQHAVPFQASPVVKHSINNVFHSLNEYLNSNISNATLPVKTVEEPGPSDNNVDFSNVPPEEPVSKAEAKLDETKAPAEELDTIPKEVQLVLLEDAEESVLRPAETTQPIEGSGTPEPSAAQSRKTENLDYSLLDLEDSPKPTPSFINDNRECDINVNGKADLDNNNADKETDDLSPDSTDQKEDGNSEDLLVKIDEDNFENFVVEPSNSPYALGIADVEQSECSTPRVELQEVEATAVEHVEESSEVVESEPAAEEERATVQAVEEDVELPCTNDVELEENSAKSEVQTALMVPELPAAKIASFSADLEIDENELNKMLEDLELEEQEDGEEKAEELPAREVVDTTEQPEISEKSADLSALVTSQVAEVGKSVTSLYFFLL